MNFDFVNIVTLFSVVVTVVFLVYTIFEVRKDKNEHKKLVSKREETMSDYDKVLRSTHGLENARERNTGMHFDDETVYLNRARAIRNDSSLFSWINEY